MVMTDVSAGGGHKVSGLRGRQGGLGMIQDCQVQLTQ